MAEVARIAGVSTTTVSHVLNRTRKVAPETEHSVRAALAQTGYRHNLAARALATQSTDTIGLAMSMITNPYFADLVRGIERRLRAAGYTLVLADTNDDPTVEADVVDHLLARRVSGLIVSPLAGDHALDESFRHLLADSFPLVFLDRRTSLPADQVYSECTQSVRDLTAHLADHGHRRIAYVAGSHSSMSSRDRLRGYRQAARELGLDDDPALVLTAESDERRAEALVLEHLASPEPATAMVVSNNQMTIGTMRAFKELGLSVPNDIALVCYDDFEWADLFEPRLSAVAQDAERLASACVELLLARLGAKADRPQSVVIPTVFNKRRSCGCP